MGSGEKGGGQGQGDKEIVLYGDRACCLENARHWARQGDVCLESQATSQADGRCLESHPV